MTSVLSDVELTNPNVGAATGVESNLSPYVGPYVTEMLGRGAGIASEPYQAYMGPLTAGPSDLQTKAFEGIGSINIPTSNMGAFTPPDIYRWYSHAVHEPVSRSCPSTATS